MTASAQDGKLVDTVVVNMREDDLRALQVAVPDIRDLVNLVDIKSIGYLSDGLKVKGYLVVPRQGVRLPCVIFNRGGNREFGALDDRVAALLLARIASWGYVVVASQYRGNAGGGGEGGVWRKGCQRRAELADVAQVIAASRFNARWNVWY